MRKKEGGEIFFVAFVEFHGEGKKRTSSIGNLGGKGFD